MKNLKIMDGLKSTFYKTSFQMKKHSPEILIVAGVIGVVTSGVMLCRSTLKAAEVMDKAHEDLDRIHTATENGETERGEEYTEEDRRKDLAIVYSQTAIKMVKIYAPAVGLGVLSLSSIVASNNILRKRNVALSAAYAAIDKSFKEYRGRVKERYGDEVDRQLRYGIKAQKIEKTVVDPETGKEKKVKETVEVVDGLGNSEYARFFDDGCAGWEKDAEMNLTFLSHVERYFNELLRTRGWVFLNEVYHELGIPESRAGQVVGWVYDPENGTGDNYISFGIHDMYRNNGKCRDFVNGYERTILLDFNVDGPILDCLS